MATKSRSLTLAAGLAALAALTVLSPPAPAAAQSFPTPAITVEGGQYDSAYGFLPGQPVPVQAGFACGYLCQQTPPQTEWWIWAELPGDVPQVLSYDGATQRWRTGLAPSFVREAGDLPLQLLPGRLELPPGLWFLHFEIDTDPNGVRDTAVDGVDWFEATVDSFYLHYSVQVDPGFFDDFFDGKADGWTDDGGGAWGVASRRYRLRPGGAPAVFTSLHKGGFSDFTFGADVRLRSGGTDSDRRGVGLLFRASRFYRDGYVFHVNAAGSFLIFKRVAGRTRPLMPGWAKSAAINRGPGAWNRLVVQALGDQLLFSINDTVVRQLTDARFTQGRAGVKAFGDGGAGDVFEFDNVFLRAGGY